MIILFGGKEYAVGLNWFSISSRDEIEQFKREMDMTRGVVKFSKEEGEASAIALAPTEYINQISLAAALSYVYHNLLYVCKTEYKDEMGRQLYYFCCVKQGAVTVDGDIMGDIDSVQSLYAQSLLELRADFPEDTIECLGTDVDDTRFESVQLVGAADIVLAIQRFESQCVIKELRTEGKSKRSIILMVIAILGLCYFGYQWWKPAPAPPPTPTKVVRAAPAAPPVDPFTQLINSAHLESTVLPAAIPVLEKAVKVIPMQFNGWRVEEINAVLGESTTFSFTLVRTPYATVLNLKKAEAAGLLKNVHLDPTGNKATAYWGGNIAHMPLLTKDALLPIKSTAPGQFQEQFMSLAQAEAVEIKWDTVKTIGNFSIRTFTYEGTGLWALSAFNDIFKSIPTMGVTSVHITPNEGEYKWKLQGVIYG